MYKTNKVNIFLFLLVFLIFVFKSFSNPKYELTCRYLINPDTNIVAMLNEADFWIKAKDDINGGFYSYVDKKGNPIYPPDYYWFSEMCGVYFDFHLKQIIGQARMSYIFSKAYMVTGDDKYLELAKHALDFLYEKGWDQETEGWKFTVNEFGEYAPWLPCDWWDPNGFKWGYVQTYPILGMAAYYEVTNESHELEWMNKSFEMLNEKLWDARPEYPSYFAEADYDWGNPRRKDFSMMADAITSTSSPMYLLSNDIHSKMKHKKRLLTLADNILDYLVESMDDSLVNFGMVELFDSDGNIIPPEEDGFIGHILKAAWCLGKAYLVCPKDEYREGAKKLINEVLDNGGYDYDHGGPFTFYNWETGEITEGKNYWTVEQAITSGIVNSYISNSCEDKNKFLKMADESMSFYMNNFVDWEDGGSYMDLENDGTVIDPNLKGDVWKAGYHGVELNYLAYIYGNLMLKKKPVSLYYNFEPTEEKKFRYIQLNPIEFNKYGLVIDKVELNGKKYCFYSSNHRLLFIPKGFGGKFKVTFKNRSSKGKACYKNIDYKNRQHINENFKHIICKFE